MPAISAPATVLVTGANGFIGIAVVENLLKKGFKVRAQVRSAKKGQDIKDIIRGYEDNLEYVIVEDLNKIGALDDALVGVEGAIHLGGPLPIHSSAKPKDIIQPAVDSMTHLLDSARKAGTIKRVVVTSTIVAIASPKEGAYEYSESDWNDVAVQAAEQLGEDAPNIVAYGASKVLLERAAFEYGSKSAQPINFDIASVIPTMVSGAPKNVQESVNIATNFGSLSLITIGLQDYANWPQGLVLDSYVDVLDVAEIYARVLTTPEAANERFFALAGLFSWEKTFDALNKSGIKGYPAASGEFPTPLITYDNSKAKRILGIDYIPLKESFLNTYEEYVKRGWVSPHESA